MGKKRVVYNYGSEDAAKTASALEEFLFGGGAAGGKLLAPPDAAAGPRLSIAQLVKQAEAQRSDQEDDDDELMFVEDRAGADESDAEAAEADDADEPAGPGPGSLALAQAGKKGTKRGRAPVWVDPADAELSVPVASVPRMRKLRASKEQAVMSGREYEAALRRQHAALNPRTSWASPGAAAAAAAAKRGAAGDGGGDGPDDAAEPDEATARLLLAGSGLLLGGGRGSSSRGGLLAPGTLELSRLRDANGASPSDAVVQALQWHPNGQLMLTAGFDKRLQLFQVDGLRNPLVQSLFLADCPIHSAAFAGGGASVVAAGRRPFYYVADLNTGALERVVAPACINLAPSGAPGSSAAARSAAKAADKLAAAAPGAKPKRAPGGGRLCRDTKGGAGPGSKAGTGMKSCESFVASPAGAGRPLLAFLGDNGHVGLVSLSSRACVGSLKMNGSARAAAFSSDGATLVTAGGDGVIYTWDLRSHRCLQQQRDAGAVTCTSLALSPDGSYLATGDSMGAVSVYRRPAGLLAPLGAGAGAAGAGGLGTGGGAEQLAPLKTLMNLTTSVDSLAFSHDGQLLLMGSRLQREGLRLVHLPSLTVFANWPTSRSPLNYVHCAALSPHSGFLAIGTAKGRALLYRLHHWDTV